MVNEMMEQNHFPGATNRWLAPRVDAVCVPSEAARERLGGVGIVTGNPVREEFTRIGDPPSGERLSVLVLGGSRGARSINRAMSAAVPGLARLETPPRIVHQTGSDDEAEVRAAYADYAEGAWEVAAFLDDVPARLAAAAWSACPWVSRTVTSSAPSTADARARTWSSTSGPGSMITARRWPTM